MNMKRNYAVLGGDARQLALCEYLADCGNAVCAFGLPRERFSSRIKVEQDWKQAVQGADAVILPLPASSDGRRVHLPLGEGAEAPTLKELFALADKIPVMGGKFSPAVKEIAERDGILLFDYFESEELQLKNALPTAEGAVSVLMREVPRTVNGLPVGVTGFGRVAKALIRLLLAMGAHVTVTARKTADLLAARALGCNAVLFTGTASLRDFAKGQGVVFNTVPHWLFSQEVLREMEKKTLIIDLASAPGGVDGEAAEANGIRVIWALSLPGKYAPQTAGEIIAQTVLSYWEDRV